MTRSRFASLASCAWIVAAGFAAAQDKPAPAPKAAGQPAAASANPASLRQAAPRRLVEAAQAALAAAVAKGDAQLLFIGDSITQGWEGAGKEVWKKYYGQRNADEPRHRRRPDAARPVAARQRQRRRHLAQAGRADDRHQQLRGSNRRSEIAAGIKAIVDEAARRSCPRPRSCCWRSSPAGPTSRPQLPPVDEGPTRCIAKLADGKMVHYLDIGEKFLSRRRHAQQGDHARPAPPERQGLRSIWAEAIEPKLKNCSARSRPDRPDSLDFARPVPMKRARSGTTALVGREFSGARRCRGWGRSRDEGRCAAGQHAAEEGG